MFLGMDMRKYLMQLCQKLDIFHGIGLSYMHQSMGTSVRPKPAPGD